VESLFIAYRLTGDEQYRVDGWRIFQAIQKYCLVESGGYASLLNVDDVNSVKMDKMETFFMVSNHPFCGFLRVGLINFFFFQSETLKYFYLLFSEPSLLPLDSTCFFLTTPRFIY
jgi:mannosyl-oligosaccharide alpha-1,2-mannosidase